MGTVNTRRDGAVSVALCAVCVLGAITVAIPRHYVRVSLLGSKTAVTAVLYVHIS